MASSCIVYESFCLLVCFLTVIVVDGAYRSQKVTVPTDLGSLRIFTDDEIAKYDGSDSSLPLYMAVKGVVFDVTAGKEFYGQGMSYNALTGKDSSRAVAKMSLDEKDLNSDVSDLSDAHLKALDDIFTGTYQVKYTVVGYMDYLINKRTEL